ncbi:MAG: hypothetical protein Q8P67_11335 [archaeon]|nr:hypothetical protein [archaeon]
MGCDEEAPGDLIPFEEPREEATARICTLQSRSADPASDVGSFIPSSHFRRSSSFASVLISSSSFCFTSSFFISILLFNSCSIQ